MEIIRRPLDPEAAQFADLLDAVLAPDGAQRAPAPEDRLADLLQVAVASRDALQVAPARPAREAARRAMLNHAANRTTGTAGSFQVPGFATAGALSAAVMLASLFGTVNAAEAALPGDLLYPLKGALEHTLIALTPSEAARLQLKIDFASRRVAELEVLHEQARDIPADLLERTAGQMQDIVVASKALPADAPQLRQLGSVARKSLEVLTDVSESVPEPAKPGLQQTIAASQQAQAAVPPPQRPNPAAPVVPDGPRVGGGQPPTATPTATVAPLLPSRSGPSRQAADRDGSSTENSGRSDDQRPRGGPSATATPTPDDREDDRNRARGGRDDDDRPNNSGPGRSDPSQDGGRNSAPARQAEPTEPARPSATVAAPAATQPGGTTSSEPRRTRPDDDDEDERRRPAASPTPRPRNEDDGRGGPGRGGCDDRDDGGARPSPTAERPLPTIAPPAPTSPTVAPPTAVPPTPPAPNGPLRNQRDGEDDNRGRNGQGNDNQGNDNRDRGNDDGGRNRSPQATPTPEPPRNGPQRGRN